MAPRAVRPGNASAPTAGRWRSDLAVLRLDVGACVVAPRRLVDAVVAPWAVLLELSRRRREDDARAVAGSDEHVPRLRRAMDEVPLSQRALLPLDDREPLAVQHEEVLLLGFPVVHRVCLAGREHLDRHAEHREERLGLVLVAPRERQAVATVATEPARVMCIQDEPAVARRDEPGVRLS